jgi:hypothetical protein
MPSRTPIRYQYRFLDYRDHLESFSELEFESDELACERAKSMRAKGTIEVWERARFVCRVDETGLVRFAHM